ncbi:MAG: hypothetical protein A3G18_01830 [Rhodospirillales bacterium RIFCSPLOWO2_12_FULL_58_28]|nr:MAG: hypothetical protein A3H92_07685 [Rhodospirillales bacterium RIFCSPLOWO2_02_FULL_58_16]OHC79036.1 MAG: hypothetical protein A3G18_01830 [Rhodospirillales bacterium RIFCSPLOWO2_12_FULL_58_28]
MKSLVIAFAILMMIAGGTVSVLKWLKIGPFAVQEEVVEQAPPEPPVFIDIDPLTIPVFQGDKVAVTFQVQIKLETVGAANDAVIRRQIPRISDAFLRELYSFIPVHLKKNEQLDFEAIRQRLLRVSDKVAGKGVITNVLIQSATATPGR